MFNSIEYATAFQNELDKAMLAESCTGWMESNTGMLKYLGGADVKIPSIVLQGLADYDRENGYKQGALSVNWQLVQMTQDRGRSFNLDANDVDETNFVLTAGNVMSEFQRTKVVPEVDAYRVAKLVTEAGEDRSRSYTAAESTILKELKADITAVRDKVGDTEQLVCMMSIPVNAILDNSEKLSKQLDVMNFERGEAHMQVKAIDGVPILRVPSSRMYSAITMNAEGEGGYTKAEGAVGVNWIICVKTSPIAVSKTDTVRIFPPEQYPLAHAWHVDYRKYHDLWLPNSKKDGVFVNLAST